MYGKNIKNKNYLKLKCWRIASTGEDSFFFSDFLDLVPLDKVHDLPELGSLELSALDVKLIIDKSKSFGENRIQIIKQGLRLFVKKSEFLTKFAALQEIFSLASLRATQTRKSSQRYTGFIKQASAWYSGDILFSTGKRKEQKKSPGKNSSDKSANPPSKKKDKFDDFYKCYIDLLTFELEKLKNQSDNGRSLEHEIKIIENLLKVPPKDVKAKLSEMTESYNKNQLEKHLEEEAEAEAKALAEAQILDKAKAKIKEEAEKQAKIKDQDRSQDRSQDGSQDGSQDE